MLKMIAVRIPEKTHRYLKQTALNKEQSLQDLIAEIFCEYQKQDKDYQHQISQSVTDALNGLANLQGESHV